MPATHNKVTKYIQVTPFCNILQTTNELVTAEGVRIGHLTYGLTSHLKSYGRQTQLDALDLIAAFGKQTLSSPCQT